MKTDCPCGKEFHVAQWQIDAGRGKYCSRPCMYKYRTRPKGLKYNLKVENPAWIKKGQRLSPDTEFQKGHNPHNFAGDDVGYDGLHDWVKRWRGKAMECEFCGSKKNVQWANKSFEYKRELDDWLELCAKCHRNYDQSGDYGAAGRIFEKRTTGGYGGRK